MPAVSADLLTALFSAPGPARPGTLWDVAHQRGPPGHPAGGRSELDVALLPFAALLSGLTLPPPGGASSPPPGNVLPETRFVATRPAVLPQPWTPAAPSSTAGSPAPGRIPASPPVPGRPPTLDPQVPAPAPTPASPVVVTGLPPAGEPAPTDGSLRHPSSVPPAGVDPATLGVSKSAAVETPVSAPALGAANRPAAAAAEPTPARARATVAWTGSEPPDTLELQAAPPETPGKAPPRELPRDLQGLARQATAPVAPGEAGGAPTVVAATTTAASVPVPGDAPTPLSTPLGSTPLGHADPGSLASRVHWMIDHSVGEAHIKLNPPELGSVDVKITMIEEKAYVQLAAHQAGATELLEAALPRLRELLNAGGLELGGATVRHEGAEGGSTRPRLEAEAESVEAETHEAPPPPPPATTAPGRVDLYA